MAKTIINYLQVVGTELELVEVENSAVNSTNSDQDSITDFNIGIAEPDSLLLPDIIVTKMLKQLTDVNSLLNSRLVCTQWNQIIENTSKLINKIMGLRGKETFMKVEKT